MWNKEDENEFEGGVCSNYQKDKESEVWANMSSGFVMDTASLSHSQSQSEWRQLVWLHPPQATSRDENKTMLLILHKMFS